MTKYNWLFRKIRNFESTFWIKKLWSLLKKHSNLYTLKTCVFKKFGSTPAFIMYIWGAVSAWKLKTAIYNFLTLLCKMGYREIWSSPKSGESILYHSTTGCNRDAELTVLLLDWWVLKAWQVLKACNAVLEKTIWRFTNCYTIRLMCFW